MERSLLDTLVAEYNSGKENAQQINRNQLLQVAVRNLVDLGPEFLNPEIQALKETNRYLLGIGRNVNQLVKKIHQGELDVDAFTENYLKTIAAYVVESREHIETIVQRNQKRAQVPYKDGTR
jgi:hypothetical protein